MAAAGTTSPPSTGPDRRRVWIAAGAVFGVLGLLLLLVVLVAPDVEPEPSSGDDRAGPAIEAPSIIPRPEEGRAPEEPGEPGTPAQLLVGLGLLLSVVTVGALAWRSSVKARASRPRPG